MNEHFLECLHELLQRAALGLDSERSLDAVADGTRELGQTNRKLVGRGVPTVTEQNRTLRAALGTA